MKGLELFDIKLVDHIILTLDSYTSMAEEGLMQ
jgi:DNA repair protein RadC